MDFTTKDTTNTKEYRDFVSSPWVPSCPLWEIMAAIRIGIVTVSDRASQGVYEDRGGPAIRDCLLEILSCSWEPDARLIPDEQPVIEATLRDLCDREVCCLVVSTGGTGPARRDV